MILLLQLMVALHSLVSQASPSYSKKKKKGGSGERNCIHLSQWNAHSTIERDLVNHKICVHMAHIAAIRGCILHASQVSFGCTHPRWQMAKVSRFCLVCCVSKATMYYLQLNSELTSRAPAMFDLCIERTLHDCSVNQNG